MANYLKQQKTELRGNYKSVKVALVMAEWNSIVTQKMADESVAELLALGVQTKHITTYKVSGSFEIPYVAAQIAKQNKADVVICLGCIIKGETIHDEVLAYTVTAAILNLNLTYNQAFILGVLTTNTLKQAIDRSNGKKGNKGRECARAALSIWETGNAIRLKAKAKK